MTTPILFNIGSKPTCGIHGQHVWDGEPNPDTRCRCGARTWADRGTGWTQNDDPLLPTTCAS